MNYNSLTQANKRRLESSERLQKRPIIQFPRISQSAHISSK